MPDNNYTTTQIFSLSLKQVQIIESVARHNGFALAADHLNMTQSVISRAIKSAEKSLKLSIFQRGWGGAEPTALGEIIVQHCLYTLTKIQNLEFQINGNNAKNISLLPFLKWHHLQAIAAVTRHHSVSTAAQNLGLKQPAVSRTINAAAQYLGADLFTRQRRGVTPSNLAWKVATLFDELNNEFKLLPLKLTNNSNDVIGRVAVGMLPFSGQDLVAKAFGKLTKQHPALRLIAVSGAYNMLIQALRHGEIDCIMGMLRQPSPHQDLAETYIYTEQYALIARKNHPCHIPNINAKSLQNQRWIGAPYGTPVREYLESFFTSFGLTPPTQTCEIHSFTNAEQMIIESESIALLSYSPQKLAALRPELKAIDIKMPAAQNAIGLTYLAAQTTSEPVQIFQNTIIQLAKNQ